MLQAAPGLADSDEPIQHGRVLLGPGWREVDTVDDLDPDEYETDEEEIYVTLDLGQLPENGKAISTESQFQLVGLNEPTPFIKVGNRTYQGKVTPLIGDEIVLGLQRNPDDPHNPHHRPLHVTNRRITFTPVILHPIDRAGPSSTRPLAGDVKPSRAELDSALASRNQSELVEGTRSMSVATRPAEAEREDDSSDEFVPEGSSARRKGKAASKPKRPGRPKGAMSKPKLVIRSVEEYESMNVASMPEDIRLEVTPEVRDALQAKYGLVGLKATTLTPLELERMQKGWPKRGPGSRGGRLGLRKVFGYRNRPGVLPGDGGEDEDENDEGVEDEERESRPSRALDASVDPSAGITLDAAGGNDVIADSDTASPPPSTTTSRRKYGLGETAPREPTYMRKAVHRALHGTLEGEITEPTLVVSGLPGQVRKKGRIRQPPQKDTPGTEDVEMAAAEEESAEAAAP